MASRDVEYYTRLHNLTELAVLDEHSLLSALRYRYDASLIYTNVGEILIALNPFRPLTVYGPGSQLAYKRAPQGDDGRLEVPHIYAVARRVYSDMRTIGRDQVCVISGESGAGKTESSKFLIRQVMELCRSPSYGSNGLEAKIVQVNPLLEAFGNAKTEMNCNSSRFGKYLSLMFDSRHGHVMGASVNQYLLEKSRVARQAHGERNFHVFYYMFAGLPETMLGKVNLKRPSHHRYLASDVEADEYCQSEECVEGFRSMQECMDAVEMTVEHAMEVFQLLAGILLIGDLEFGNSDTAFISPSNGHAVDAAKALGLDAPALCRSLTVSTNITRGEIITISYSPEKAADCRDATAKAIYGRLFNFIVSFINGVLASEKPGATKFTKIGVLDIFGFENFGHNSFEQFCINLANEELQHLFNECVFQMEKEELKKEGVRSPNINYRDNLSILQLILHKPIGILSLLDEQSVFPRGTDQTFLEKLDENFAKHQDFAVVKGRSQAFAVKHYAGKVTYKTDGFLEKNRDTLAANILDLLKTSHFGLLKALFLDEALGRASTLVRKREVSLHLNRKHSTRVQGGGRSKAYVRNAPVSSTVPATSAAGARNKNSKGTVGSQFRQSLQRLMGKLRNASPHFIRCVKANRLRKPGEFDENYVLDQLRYAGVLETVRIRREGYAYRPSFGEFLHVYANIGHPFNAKVKPTAVNCSTVLEKAGISGWQAGKNKLFLKYYHVDQLRQTLQEQHKHAAAVQRFIRGYFARRLCKELRAQAAAEAKVVSGFCRQVSLSHRNTTSSLIILREEDAKRQTEKQEKMVSAAKAFRSAQKENGAKNVKPARPPQPSSTLITPPNSPRSQPSVAGVRHMPEVDHSSSDEEIYGRRPVRAPTSAVPVLPVLPAGTHLSPNYPRHHVSAAGSHPSMDFDRSSSGESAFDEDIYSRRPEGVPSSAVSVLPTPPAASPRNLTPSPRSRQPSPLASDRLSPFVVPAPNGMRYVVPTSSGMKYAAPNKPPRSRDQSPLHNAGKSPNSLSPPSSQPVPPPRQANAVKRSPSKHAKTKGAKRNSQSALTTYYSPTGFKLNNVKIRQHAADDHPAIKRYQDHKRPNTTLLELAKTAKPSTTSRYHDDSFGISSSGDELDEDTSLASSSDLVGSRPASEGDLPRRMANGLVVDSQTESAEWFCGLVSRTRADELLKGHISGTFLIRTSESRFGYACSVSWHERIKHFIIELLPAGKVQLFGKPAVYEDLHEFVEHFRDHPLSDDGVLLLAPLNSKTKPVSELEAARRELTGVAGYQGRSGWGRRGEKRGGTLKRKASMMVATGQKPEEPKKSKGWWRRR